MSYTDEEKRSLYNTPVTELEIVDINDLVPNTLYLCEYINTSFLGKIEKEVVVVSDLTLRGQNRNTLVGKYLTDKYGNLHEMDLIIFQRERNLYKFYKKRTHPAGLHEEIKEGHPKGHIPTLRELAYKNLPPDQKDEYYKGYEERLVPHPPHKGGSKIKRKIKINTKRNNKRSRSLRGKSKTKTKTRKQK
jgi:hypothetical protein